MHQLLLVSLSLACSTFKKNSLARYKYLSVVSLSFIFTLWSAKMAKSTIQPGLCVVYSHTNTSGNIIKFTNFNERTNTLLYKKISLTLYSRKGSCFCCVWEMGGETYTKREEFFPYLLPGARGCQRLHPLAS